MDIKYWFELKLFYHPVATYHTYRQKIHMCIKRQRQAFLLNVNIPVSSHCPWMWLNHLSDSDTIQKSLMLLIRLNRGNKIYPGSNINKFKAWKPWEQCEFHLKLTVFVHSCTHRQSPLHLQNTHICPHLIITHVHPFIIHEVGRVWRTGIYSEQKM